MALIADRYRFAEFDKISQINFLSLTDLISSCIRTIEDDIGDLDDSDYPWDEPFESQEWTDLAKKHPQLTAQIKAKVEESIGDSEFYRMKLQELGLL